MTGVIIVKGSEDVHLAHEIGTYVEMRIRRFIDKVSYKPVGDSKHTVVLNVRTKRNTFEELKEELNDLYPKKCVFLRKD